MSGKAAKIKLTENQHAILQQIVRSTTAPQRLVQRARLIVLAFDGMFNRVIASGVPPDVPLWHLNALLLLPGATVALADVSLWLGFLGGR